MKWILVILIVRDMNGLNKVRAGSTGGILTNMLIAFWHL